MYIAPQNELPPVEMRQARLDSSWITLLITASFASIVFSLWYLRVLVPVDETSRVGRWTSWAVAGPDFRQVIDHHSLRKLAAAGASQPLGQMILLRAPVWVLAFPREIQVSAGDSLRSLMIILSILAFWDWGPPRSSRFSHVFCRPESQNRARRVDLPGNRGRDRGGPMQLPVYLVMSIWSPKLGRLEPANLLLYLVRTTRLVNGITPLMPFLYWRSRAELS